MALEARRAGLYATHMPAWLGETLSQVAADAIHDQDEPDDYSDEISVIQV